MYIRKMLQGLKNNPVDFLKRVLFKTVIGPLKYCKKDGYDASRYWGDRFSKYGIEYKGAGDESISNEENEKVYQRAQEEFRKVFEKETIDIKNAKILEIGVGAAFFTKLLFEMGAQHVMGVDITEVLFEQHKAKFPHYSFVKKDITADTIEGDFDIVTMIDVVQHITKREKVTAAMQTIKKCLKSGGKFFIGPLTAQNKKHHFYVNNWSADTIKQHFEDCHSHKLFPFKGSYLLIIEKSE